MEGKNAKILKYINKHQINNTNDEINEKMISLDIVNLNIKLLKKPLFFQRKKLKKYYEKLDEYENIKINLEKEIENSINDIMFLNN